MGVKKRDIQRRWWRLAVGTIFLLSVVLLLNNRSILGSEGDSCVEWAPVTRLIPPVVAYEFDSSGCNALDEVNYKLDPNLEREAYRIVSDVNGIKVFHGDKGDHRARSTIKQLALLANNPALPWGTIEDRPAFHHRGVLMDVCRHFFTVDEVKRHLDVMALYKFNVLHWHLTEDQGWRIAMDAYPKLAEVAAYRTHGDSTYGGFYTREDLESVVAYAAKLGIEVIPEIEMPGHSQAALAAYPELGCTGESVEVAKEWGVFKEIYCAGNEETFEFLEDVLDYICEIFPSKYIHIGGDEAPKFRWEHCSKCQKRMKDEGLHDEEALQGWFNTRIENYLATKGKQIIGWDEILEGGLSPNATVQSWRGFEGAIQAAQQGHDAIVSPTSHAYFDYPVSSIDVPKVYSYSPIPKDLDPLLVGHILGGECNLWAERIPDTENLDRRFLPRGIAMAEVLWSNPKDRDYDEFWNRLQGHYSVLDTLGYKYDVEQVPVKLSTKNDSFKEELKVVATIESAFENLDLEIGAPTGMVMGSTTNFTERGVHELKVQPSRDGHAMGKELVYRFSVHEGLLTHSCLTSTPTEPYTGSKDIPLANGVLGSTNYRDGNWLGYYGPDFFSGHFGWDKPYVIDSIKINFLQSRLSWILIPEKVITDVYESEDQISRYEWERRSSTSEGGTFIETMVLAPKGGFSATGTIDIKIPNTEVLPDDHSSAGESVWHFLDEVQIYGRPL